MLIRLLLIAVSPFFLVAWALNRLLGRDALRLREPQSGSLWIQRRIQPSAADYFSQASAAEGLGHGGYRGGNALLRALARLMAPRRAQPGAKFSPAADREQGIPDEVYTLW